VAPVSASELNLISLHSMNPNESKTFGYRTSHNKVLHTVVC
jgi:hypothetical protein